jgi:hypothetical protein
MSTTDLEPVFWKGKPDTEMNEEELRTALRIMARIEQSSREARQQERDAMRRIREARR